MIKEFFNWIKAKSAYESASLHTRDSDLMDKLQQEIDDNKPSKFLRISNTQKEDKVEKDLQRLFDLAKKQEPLKHGVLASSDYYSYPEIEAALSIPDDNEDLQAKLKKTLQDFGIKKQQEEKERELILKDIFKEVIAPGMIECAERGIPLYSFILNKAEEVSLEPLFKLNSGHWLCKGEYIQSKYENLRLNKSNIEFIFNEIKKNGFEPYYDDDRLIRQRAQITELSENRMEYPRIMIKFPLVPK